MAGGLLALLSYGGSGERRTFTIAKVVLSKREKERAIRAGARLFPFSETAKGGEEGNNFLVWKICAKNSF